MHIYIYRKESIGGMGEREVAVGNRCVWDCGERVPTVCEECGVVYPIEG